jgi:DNA invertase Pin-like site-specific DNA recombinase
MAQRAGGYLEVCGWSRGLDLKALGGRGASPGVAPHAPEESRPPLAVLYLRDGEPERDLRTWAEEHGYVVVGSVSASEDPDPPSLLLDLCGRSGAGTVLVRDLQTLGPSLQSSYEALRRIYGSGISVVFVDRGLRVDGRTALGRLLMEALSMAVGLAASQQADRQLPRRAGRPPRALDESELRRLRDMGLSVRAIARELDVSKSTVWRKLKELEAGPPEIGKG